MRYYHLSESRLKRVIRYPARVEEGILEGAVACMQEAGSKRYSEIWVMYVLTREGGSPALPRAAHKENSVLSPRDKERGQTATRLAEGIKKIKVITAWRYPGRAPERDPVPVEILQEIKNIL